MKNIIRFASFGLLGLVMAGCAETDIDYYEVSKPQSIADYEYLNDYASVKDYVNRENTPGFTLGIAASANDYLNKGVVYRLVNHNFDIITAGNEMKYASIVQNDGTMDFSTVESFVEAAEEAGIQIYGHTLCWHAQQNTTWLNSLIKDLVADEEGTVADKQKAVLEAEMERWIAGMMEATHGYVKAWDVVNEAISGGPAGKRYDLQHGSADNKSDFFWQDYLGDNFVRVPVKYARQYFEENGGNPEDLKLFINDYNLESDWDDNAKLISLIQWIRQWESDGVTKIDGIGSQMHISYYMNPNTQKSKENHIVKMLELMANTGKLCRITELDMGICDENGKDIATEDVTLEQHKLMADYYSWIIQKYFEIIPKAQQFGICQWCITDAPEKSGWRANSPVGLWNLNYVRKPAYAGFCEGLEIATNK